VVAKDIKNLGEMIYSGIQENLEADKVNPIFIEQYVQHMDRIEYMKTSERSIIGQMNDAIYYIECVQEDDGIMDVQQLNRRLNEFPMIKLPLKFSGRMMMQEMENRFA
jgi:hypothetical protein